MWRIGELARMAGVTERTLRHYDKIGLLVPAAVDRATGYRWYGVAELSRLERIRGLRRLGLPLRQIADVIDAPDTQVRQALRETVAAIHREIAALAEVADRAEDHLARPMSILPRQTTVGARHLHVRYLTVGHPREIAVACAARPTTLLTWLRGHPDGGFTAALGTGRTGERLTLPARTVVRAVVPSANGIVQAGQDLFDWLHRHHLVIAGPTVEEQVVDGDGVRAAILEVPVEDQFTPPLRRR
ncbi:helix-turn-helix domain-containing protein [Plantactinospora solaniradicis]|uniref:Helix-turn-helix domain-containing protein n=1 Tax=Plantactinospora solaniradicis TaxID=1723736 RepID=A0ABW1K654_9ACTN